jgi:3-hydroxybutyryl-CoA dehydrogenase
MTFDANRPDLTIGILGAGAMGRGIAQVAAAGGMHVVMMDARAGAAQEARDFVGKMLLRAAEKGSLTQQDVQAALGRIKIVNALADFKPCHALIEAVAENLDVKRQVFGELEAIVAPDCILATNTSSLSVTTVAARLKTPQRFAGFHFFNPVPLMRLVEVISGLQTEEWVCEALVAIGKRMTREPVRCTDAPGFLVNQVGRGFTLEAAHLVYEGISNFADVDRVIQIINTIEELSRGTEPVIEIYPLKFVSGASLATIVQTIYDQMFATRQGRVTIQASHTFAVRHD